MEFPISRIPKTANCQRVAPSAISYCLLGVACPCAAAPTWKGRPAFVPAHFFQTAKYEPEPNQCSDFRAEHLGHSRTIRFFFKACSKIKCYNIFYNLPMTFKVL